MARRLAAVAPRTDDHGPGDRADTGLGERGLEPVHIGVVGIPPGLAAHEGVGGADRAREIADPIVDRAHEIVGFLPPR